MANRWRKAYQRDKKRAQRWQKIQQTLNKWKRRAPVTLGLFGVLAAALISLGAHFGWNTPTWQQIYTVAGLGSSVSQVEADTQVHFIDVGQGDATLLESNGRFALIDAGPSKAQEDLVSYLKAVGVTELDYLILTHPHADHMGGMQAVLQNFDVKQVLLPNFDLAPVEQTTTLTKLQAAIEAEECAVRTMRTGDVYLLGGSTLQVLLAGIESDNVNDISPALLFTAPNLRFLCTGDAEAPVERALLDNDTDVQAELYKAGHHGSSTSNTEAFVQAVAPDVAVVSCAADNDYGHPHREVLQTFAQNNVQVYVTAQEGTIVAYVDDAGALRVATSDSYSAAA
jgi:beta-lactamase superfamily II metal-dependent hydrolase